MTKSDPIIAVKDVEASSNWYQAVFDCTSMHGGEEFDILVSEKDETLLCLHKWGHDGHPTMTDPNTTPGNGLILYFRSDNMERIRKNAGNLDCIIEEEIHLNLNSKRMEFSLRDPDGYYITLTEFHIYQG